MHQQSFRLQVDGVALAGQWWLPGGGSAAIAATDTSIDFSAAGSAATATASTASTWPPGLLCAHGLGQTRSAWRQTAQRLAGHGFPVLAADARGHGDSARNRDGQAYDPGQLADDLAAWAGTFKRPPVLVGASMGGLAGLIAQSRHACFCALVLVDITPRWEPEGVARILAFMRAHSDGFDSIGQAAEVIAAYMPHRPRKSAQALAGLLARDGDGRWRWHWDPRLIDDMNRDIEQRQAQLFQAARAIRVPTLLVTGGASDVVSPATINEFLQLVPHARHREIAHARHLIAGDDNDAFASAVLEFIHSPGLRTAA
ncbi:MAG: alpha/beta hydrolase [Xanthomonadales bacterium]|nr:alpha/beta hydrolase [Xanthomonadales bacterium]